MIISDIGTAGDDTALLCHTNRPPPSGSFHSGGTWFRSDRSEVLPGGSSVGFRRNRDPMVVSLFSYRLSDNKIIIILYMCIGFVSSRYPLSFNSCMQYIDINNKKLGLKPFSIPGKTLTTNQ